MQSVSMFGFVVVFTLALLGDRTVNMTVGP